MILKPELKKFSQMWLLSIVHRVISDHLQQFLIAPIFPNPPSTISNTFERDSNKFDQENFSLDYLSVDWEKLKFRYKLWVNSKNLVCKTSKLEKNNFSDNLRHTLHQDSRATIGREKKSRKKQSLNFFSKNFSASLFLKVLPHFASNLRGKCLVFYFCIIFPLKLWKIVLEIHNKIMKA